MAFVNRLARAMYTSQFFLGESFLLQLSFWLDEHGIMADTWAFPRVLRNEPVGI